MKKCFACRSEKMSTRPIPDEIEVAGYVFKANLQANSCGACGEHTFPAEEVARFEVAVAQKLCELGEHSGEAFRFMRKAIDIKAIELAQLLGTTPETISRWENAKIEVDEGAFLVLGDLVDDYRTGSSRTRNKLAALRAPKQQKPQNISIELTA